MNVEALLAGALLAASVVVARSPARRLQPTGRVVTPAHRSAPVDRAAPRRRWISAAAAGVIVAWLVGGWFGLAAGGAAAVGVLRLLARLPSAADGRRRQRLHADVPLAGDLLAATVSAGATLTSAVRAVGAAVGGPLGHELQLAARSLELGAAPRVAWAPLLPDPVTASLARPLVRAVERGSPPGPALVRATKELRREAADRAAAAAETAGVRALGPLGACFLPAFVLLGVVPLVAGLAGSLLGSL